MRDAHGVLSPVAARHAAKLTTVRHLLGRTSRGLVRASLGCVLFFGLAIAPSLFGYTCDSTISPNSTFSGTLDQSHQSVNLCIAYPTDGTLTVTVTASARIGLCVFNTTSCYGNTAGTSATATKDFYQGAGGINIFQQVGTTFSPITYTGTSTFVSKMLPPSAFFADPGWRCLTGAVAFADGSQGKPTSWQWAFGDGSGSTAQSPDHVYAAAGTYAVMLTVSNAAGSSTYSRNVNWNPLISSYTFAPQSPVAGQAVSFTDTSIGAAYWNWNFGDGATSTIQSPSHIFGTAGVYSVSLIALNNANGCKAAIHQVTVLSTPSPPAAAFTYTPATPRAGQAVSFTDTSTGAPTSWLWAFGDGTSSTAQNASHTFAIAGTYHVTLTATNAAGSSAAPHDVTVTLAGSSPVASFTFSPANPKPGQPVTFTDTSSGTPTSWSWAFGDIGAANTATTMHTFATAGTFTVALVVTNGFGSDSTSKPVRVTADVPALHADFTYSPTSPVAGTPVQFTDRSAGSPASWSWDFGDHTGSTASSPGHTFAAVGPYAVTLTVSNASAQDHTTQTLQVSSSTCSGNCLTLAGRATIKGSDVGIKGNGSPSRAVRFLDASGNATQFIAPLGSDGRYSITLPAGTYTAVCDINYIDNVDQATGGSTSTCRRAWQRRSLPGTAGAQQLDFAFPLPIVFLHGILSGPEKWDSWSSGLGGPGCDGSFPHDPGNGRADTIFFTPYYTDDQTFDNEGLYVSLQLATDFSIFSAIPPYNIIAHSKGGLVARVLHANYIQGDTIVRAVLLGTPNDGSNCFSDDAASGFYLSRCDVQALNSDAATGSWGKVDVLAIAGTKDALPLLYGWIFSACPLESGPDDGVVPVDSVFKITSVASGSPASKILPGFVVPYNHFELGSAETGWLMPGVVLPFLDGQGVGLNGKPVACPPTPYSTPAVNCTTTRPSLADYCYTGRGLTWDGHCTLAPRDRVLFSAKISWNAPPAFNQPPGSPNAILSNVTGCGDALSKGPYAAASTIVTGYQIYRSSQPITTLDPNLRVGYVSATELVFYDPAPGVGDNFYAVTAIYDDTESAPASAPPLVVAGKRRAVQH